MPVQKQTPPHGPLRPEYPATLWRGIPADYNKVGRPSIPRASYSLGRPRRCCSAGGAVATLLLRFIPPDALFPIRPFIPAAKRTGILADYNKNIYNSVRSLKTQKGKQRMADVNFVPCGPNSERRVLTR